MVGCGERDNLHIKRTRRTSFPDFHSRIPTRDLYTLNDQYMQDLFLVRYVLSSFCPVCHHNHHFQIPHARRLCYPFL